MFAFSPSDTAACFFLPLAAMAIDADGNTPLCLSLKHGQTDEVISSIIDAYPHAVTERDSDNNTMLMLALDKKTGPSVVR